MNAILNKEPAVGPDHILNVLDTPCSIKHGLIIRTFLELRVGGYFILVNVLDIVFTNILLRMHAMESNPIANYVFIHSGFHGMIAFKLLLVAFVCLITQLIAVHHMRRARQTLYLGTAIVGAVVVYCALLLARSH